MQQTAPASSTSLLDKLQSRIETRNQLNAAKSRLLTGTAGAAEPGAGEKADSESAQTETPPDKKQRADCSSGPGRGLGPRIEDMADAGLNSLTSRRRRQLPDPSVLCRRSVDYSPAPATSVASRLDEIRQRFKSSEVCNCGSRCKDVSMGRQAGRMRQRHVEVRVVTEQSHTVRVASSVCMDVTLGKPHDAQCNNVIATVTS